MSNELAIVENVNGTALEPYRDRNEVRELAQRLLSLHPAAAEVGQSGMFAVAQLALMIGASPLPGVNELHVWKAKDKIQFQLGINYFRRMAQEQGGVLWKTPPRQMNDAERAEYGIFDGQLAAICRAIRVSDMERFIALGLTPNQIFDMASAVGVSVAGQNEAKNGRPAVWTALKRCEVDVYKQLFPTVMQKLADAQMATGPNMEAGPDWGEPDDFDRHNDWTVEQINDDLFGPEHLSAVDQKTGEVIEGEVETEPIEPPAASPALEPQPEPPAGDLFADARAWLEEKIRDGKTAVGMIEDALGMTGLFTPNKSGGSAHARNVMKEYPLPNGVNGFKWIRAQAVKGPSALKIFDWTVETQLAKGDEAVADEEE